MKNLTANDPETQWPDIVSANLAALRAVFPELITEGLADLKRPAQSQHRPNRCSRSIFFRGGGPRCGGNLCTNR